LSFASAAIVRMLIQSKRSGRFYGGKFGRVTLDPTQVRLRKEEFVMISKQVGELIQEKMKDTHKMVEEEEKKNPSLVGQIKREIDVTKLPK